MPTHCILDVLAQLELTTDHTLHYILDTIVIILLSLVDSILMSP